jgi:hypothetical protein
VARRKARSAAPDEDRIGTGAEGYREAVVARPFIDLHGEPRTDSERVTQQILGAPLVVGRERDGWLWVTAGDAYRGWASAAEVTRADSGAPRYGSRGRVAIVEANSALLHLARPWAEQDVWTLPIASQLEILETEPHRFRVRLPDHQEGWMARDAAREADAPFQYPLRAVEEIVATAKRFLGVPYLWGGTTPMGLDCSGFAQLSYRLNGRYLPRDADMQFQVSRPVSDREARPADLVFFSNDSPGITHVGIIVDRTSFIHSTSRGHGVMITPRNDPFYRRLLVEVRRPPEIASLPS